MFIFPLIKPLTESFSYSYLTEVGDTSNSTTYNFSSVSFGAESATRQIIVGIVGVVNSNQSISSVTIGGVSATQVVQASNGGQPLGLYIANPTGTSGTVSVTFSTTMFRAHIGVWRMVAANSATAEDTISLGGGSTGLQTGTIDHSAGGVIIAYGIGNNTGNHGWTGVNEDFDTTVESLHAVSGASIQLSTSGTGRTITANPGSGSSVYGLVAASWR